MTKRFAFVSTLEHIPWGGCEELWTRTALRLRERGHEVYANVKKWEPPVPQITQLERAGCHIHYRSHNPPGLPERLIRRLTRRKVSDQHLKWLDALNPALMVVAQSGYYDGLAWGQACAERDIPYVTIAQNAPEFYWPDDTLGAQIQDMHRHARRNYFVAQGNVDLAGKQLGVAVPNAKVVRNPFNVSYEVSPVWPEEDGISRFACVAQLLPVHKGQDLIFEVLSLPQWRERPLHLTLVGSGANRQNLLALQKWHGLKNVTFTGFTSNIEAVWATHHAMILPSRCEGTPLAVVEALLCGRPCIVTNIAGNPEVVEDNVTGFVAAAPTVHDLVEAMERAWTRRSEWQTMGQTAAHRIRELVPPDPVGVFADELTQVVEQA